MVFDNNNFERLEAMITKTQQRIDQQTGQRQVLKANITDLKTRSKKLEQKIALETQARDLLVKASDQAREHGRALLEKTADQIVQTVFSDNYHVSITMSLRAGTPVADIALSKSISGKTQVINLANEGGGLKDLTALAVFVAIGRLTGQENRAPLLLDEPTKFVSDGRAPQAAQAIRALGDLLDKQLIIVTNERQELPAVIDHVYSVEQDSQGQSHIL